MSEWISVNERLPERGVDILAVIIVSGDYEYPGVEVVDRGRHEKPFLGEAAINGTSYNWIVAHWMPLPSLPEPPK